MACTASLMALRASNEARMSNEQRLADRARSALVLISDHLRRHGYAETAERLGQEAGSNLGKLEVADNMNLMDVLVEFEQYYEMKYQRKPRFARKKGEGEGIAATGTSSRGAGAGVAATRRRAARRQAQKDLLDEKLGLRAPVAAAPFVPEEEPLEQMGEQQDDTIQVCGSSVTLGGGSRTSTGAAAGAATVEEPARQLLEERLLKPLPSWDPDTRNLAQTIRRDIFQEHTGVSWSDVVGLENAKRLLKEAVVLPVMYPQFFTGLLSPWKGILLYGPPGTGKTMLAKAVAAECCTTFFNISASSIVSKYRGDSEKLVRVLFELARYHAPSTIFLDEIDAIMGQRGGQGGAGGGDSEHEGSRRMKTELLIQMDGLARGNERVFVLAASNLPWELDVALLRRLEKRVMVPLPDAPAREAMLQVYMEGRVQEENLASVAERTAGFSGADIRLLCKEAAMRPVRRLMSELDAVGSRAGVAECRPRPSSTPPSSLSQEMLGPVTPSDVDEALRSTKPSAQKFAPRYEQWEKDFGSS
jgi:katanin p60 ATPase-containing subunit A1